MSAPNPNIPVPLQDIELIKNLLRKINSENWLKKENAPFKNQRIDAMTETIEVVLNKSVEAEISKKLGEINEKV